VVKLAGVVIGLALLVVIGVLVSSAILTRSAEAPAPSEAAVEHVVVVGAVPQEGQQGSTPAALGSGVSRGKSGAQSGLVPEGFFVDDKLRGINSVTRPQREGCKMLVIVLSAPSRLFVPTEAEILAMRKREEAEAQAKRSTQHSGGSLEMVPSVSNTLQINANRFMVTLSDGRGDRGDTLTTWDFMPVWCPGFRQTSTAPIPEDAVIKLGVAWVLDAADCAPPFQISIDKGAPIPVPNKQLSPP
jgi:hypothetical protein